MAFIRTGDAGRDQQSRRAPAKSHGYLVLVDFAAVLAAAFACLADALAAAFCCLAAAFASLAAVFAAAVEVFVSVFAGVVPAIAGAARMPSAAKEAISLRFIIPSPGK